MSYTTQKSELNFMLNDNQSLVNISLMEINSKLILLADRLKNVEQKFKSNHDKIPKMIQSLHRIEELYYPSYRRKRLRPVSRKVISKRF
jgi:hypothetical protein